MHSMGFEPTVSPSISLLQGKDVPFELELIGTSDSKTYLQNMHHSAI